MILIIRITSVNMTALSEGVTKLEMEERFVAGN